MRESSSLIRSRDRTANRGNTDLVRTIRLVLAEERRLNLKEQHSSTSSEAGRCRRHMTFKFTEDQTYGSRKLRYESPERGRKLLRSPTPPAGRTQQSPRANRLVREDPRDEIIRQLTLRLEKVERESALIPKASKFSTEPDSPFSKGIREGFMPRSFRLPRPLEAYNGVGDPDTFLRKYKLAMQLEDANEVALCKCFKVALVGPASCWYNSLPLAL